MDLTQSSGDEASQSVEPAGRFRIYLGMAAGVGKTVAMLDEGNRRRERGADVVIGFVESHGRPFTEAQAAGLEAVARKRVEYRGATFEEMDLSAIVARRPEVVLVDELAHSNVPGSGGNEKRWEDVLELLDAGIAVISTVNVQHMESIADAVEQITGAQVRERVPDWVVRRADQIELIDSSPEQLRRRLLHGNVYPAEKVPGALNGFFRTENLVALRELVLRFLADETEEELLAFLERHQPGAVWETTERIMVAATATPGIDMVIRRAARIAARVKADLVAVHVRSSERPIDEAELAAMRKVCDDVGAQWQEIAGDDTARAFVDLAERHQITQIVVGSSRRHRLQELTRGSTVGRILRFASERGIDVHVIARSRTPDERRGVAAV